MPGRLLTRGLPVVVFGFLFLIPSEAEARRRGFLFFLITTGDTVKHVGDIPTETQALLREATEGKDVDVGFLHNRFGVFFLDLWTWGGEYVLYEGNNVWPVTKEQAAAFLGKSSDEIGQPFLYTFPPLLILVVVGAVAFVGVTIAKKVRSEEPAETAYPDSV